MITERQLRSLRSYCDNFEDIEGFKEAMADSKSYQCHHRLETHTSDGVLRQVFLGRKELIALGMYYNRPAEELVLMTTSEHVSLHKKGKTYLSEEGRQSLSKRASERTGSKNGMYGKRHSKESRELMSKHRPDVNGKNNPSYGKHWYHNDTVQVFAYECPEGFQKGMLKRTKEERL